MNPQTHPSDEFENDDLDPEAQAEDEYEEISSEEVDRVVQALEKLVEQTTSENIRAYLDEAADNIYRLVYDDAPEWGQADDMSEAA